MKRKKPKGWRERTCVARTMRTLQKRAAFLQGLIQGGSPTTDELLTSFKGMKKSLKQVISALEAQKEEEEKR